MTELKQRLLFFVQLVVVLATVAASVVALLNPDCIPQMLAEVAGASAAGMLLAGVKILSVLSRSKMACKPLSCWWCYGWAVARREFKHGLLAGYLLGLVLAMWVCANR